MAEQCGAVDFTCKARQIVSNVQQDTEQTMHEGMEFFITTVFTGWMNIPVPLLSEEFGAVGFLRSHVLILAGFLAGLSTIIFAIRLMFRPRWAMAATGAAFYARLIVVTTASVTLGRLLVSMCDSYSEWILASATQGQGLGEFVVTLLAVSGPGGWIVGMIVAVIAALLSLIQGGLLIARNIMLPLLIGMAPVVVACSQGELGMSWWRRYTGWFLAFLLFKPTAATIYAVGFYTLGQGNVFKAEGIGETIVSGMNMFYGLALLTIAVVAFPALMSVVTPVVGQLTGSGGSGSMAVTAAAAAATGAVLRVASTGNPAIAAPVSVSPTNAAAGAQQAAAGAQQATGQALGATTQPAPSRPSQQPSPAAPAPSSPEPTDEPAPALTRTN